MKAAEIDLVNYNNIKKPRNYYRGFFFIFEFILLAF